LDPAARARLLQEARAGGQAESPAHLHRLRRGRSRRAAYIAMELSKASVGRAPVARAAAVEQAVRYAQAADRTGHAHARRIVHRDLKSANIVITPDGRAKVLDLRARQAGAGGRARRDHAFPAVADQSRNRDGHGCLHGARATARRARRCPERYLGAWRGDVRDGLRGAAVRRTTGFELSSAILNESPRRLPSHVPLAFQAAVDRCLQKTPGEGPSAPATCGPRWTRCRRARRRRGCTGVTWSVDEPGRRGLRRLSSWSRCS